jgi:hypothetical protein
MNAFIAKAEQLVREGKARSYPEACSLLARSRRRAVKPVKPDAVVMRLPYADN